MRSSRSVAFFFASLLMIGFVIPSVAAQSITITDVKYPNAVDVKDASFGVEATVNFKGAPANSRLLISLFDEDNRASPVPQGSAKSTPDACVVTEQTACAILPKIRSGSERLSFRVTLFRAGVLHLAVVAAFTNAQFQDISQVALYEFTVTARGNFQLEVVVPDHVAVTIDGIQRSVGRIEMEVTPGDHEISVPAILEINEGERLKFQSWSDGATLTNRTLAVTDNMRLRATYQRQYLLTLISPSVNATGSGWYNEYSQASYSVPASQPMPGALGMLGAKWEFQEWTEEGQQVTLSNAGTIKMDHPHMLTAKWQANYTILLAILGAIGAVAAVITIFYIRRTSKRTSR